jgi:hypothetical protein
MNVEEARKAKTRAAAILHLCETVYTAHGVCSREEIES